VSAIARLDERVRLGSLYAVIVIAHLLFILSLSGWSVSLLVLAYLVVACVVVSVVLMGSLVFVVVVTATIPSSAGKYVARVLGMAGVVFAYGVCFVAGSVVALFPFLVIVYFSLLGPLLGGAGVAIGAIAGTLADALISAARSGSARS
jgi:hypothetical protein